MTRPRPQIVLAALAASWLVLTGAGAYWLSLANDANVVLTMLVMAFPYAAASWWVLRHPRDLAGRGVLAFIVGVAIVGRIALIAMPPMSSDIYRYVWDGRVQAAGINPYQYVPADPALEKLRDAKVYPNINRATFAPTAYPPAAERLYFLATRIADSVTGMKAVMVMLELAGAIALWGLLASRGMPPSRLLLYLWHPLPLFEFAGSGHIDAAAIACMLAALLWAQRRHPAWAGIALGLGAGMKFFPAFIAPALWRRWDWRLPAAFLVTMAALYAPYAVEVGARVFGYLPGYVQEEKFAAGEGVWWLALADWLGPMPHWLPTAYIAAAGLTLLLIGAAIALRHHRDRVLVRGSMVLLAGFTVALTPHYAWYFTWTVPFFCLRPSLALGYLTLASPFLYGVIWPIDALTKQAVMYLPFLVILAAELIAPRGPHTAQEIPVDRNLGPQPTA